MLAELIRGEIRRRGLNQSKAATELDVPQSILSRWLSGQIQPSAERCPRLAVFLGLRRDDVMRMAGHWEEEPDPPDGRRQGRSDPVVELCLRELREVLMHADRRKLRPVTAAIRSLLVSAFGGLDYTAENGSGKPVSGDEGVPRRRLRRRLYQLWGAFAALRLTPALSCQ